MQELTNDFIRALARANGLMIPDDRLELVRDQYREYLQILSEIGTLELPRELEPCFAPVPTTDTGAK